MASDDILITFLIRYEDVKWLTGRNHALFAYDPTEVRTDDP